jgi:hypothetical protein
MTGSATRVDEALGITEEVTFLGDGVPRLFTVLYRPLGPSVGSLLICPAILSEYDHAYATEVEFARALAAQRVTVLRFHYAGTGHSDGEPESMTLESMIEDAGRAAARLVEVAPERPPIILGLRLGAFPAAATAARNPGAPLVLWDPPLDGRTYFREAWRADMMFQINEGSAPEATRDGFPAMMERDGLVDVLGYPLCRALYESAGERSLVELIGDQPRRVLFVRGGPRSANRPAVDRLVETLRSEGIDVELTVVGDQIIWWFQGPDKRRWARPLMTELKDLTRAWIGGELGFEPRARAMTAEASA